MNEHEHNQTMASEGLYEQWENETPLYWRPRLHPSLASE